MQPQQDSGLNRRRSQLSIDSDADRMQHGGGGALMSGDREYKVKHPIETVQGGKVREQRLEKGAGHQRDGFKPTSPPELILPKPVPAPKPADSGSNKK